MSGTICGCFPASARPRRAGVSNAEPGDGRAAATRSGAALTDERQRKVADALGDLARAELQDNKKPAAVRSASGTDLARKAAKGNR